MRAVAALVLWALAAAAGAAADDGDPLHSAACREALDRLNTAEAAAASASTPGGAALEPLRRRAAQACLSDRADAPVPQPGRLAQPPQTVPPVAVPPAPRAPRPVTTAPLPAPRQPEIPTMVTSCDANGCWANDGSRLQRSGNNLLGPRGICTTQGTLLRCP
jgi:hypothetical protein